MAGGHKRGAAQLAAVCQYSGASGLLLHGPYDLGCLDPVIHQTLVSTHRADSQKGVVSVKLSNLLNHRISDSIHVSAVVTATKQVDLMVMLTFVPEFIGNHGR